jgi:PAS domain S-box-containing protein
MGGAMTEISAHAQFLFEQLFENSPDAILVTNSDGRITRANAQVERIFGYSRDELVGQLIETLIPERFRRIHPAHRNRYNAQPQPRPMDLGLELFGKRKDGSEFPVDIMLSPLSLDGTPFTLAVVRDVTRRKDAEQERDRQASIAREQAALLDLAHDSIIVRDLENRITFWNRGAEEKYGWKREEALGQLAHTFLQTQFSQPPEDVEETLRRNHYWEGEVVHIAKDGRRIVVASRRVLQCYCAHSNRGGFAEKRGTVARLV